MHLNSDLSAELPANFGPLPVRIEIIDLYKQDYQLPLHWHPEVAFVVALNGDVHVTVENQGVAVAQGQALFINSRRVHAVTAPAGSNVRIAVIVVDPGLLLQSSPEERVALQQQLGPTRVNALLLTATVTWQDAVLRRLSRLTNYYRFGGAAPLTAYMEALTICARVLPHLPASAEAAVMQPQLTTMIRYIEDHFAEPLTAEMIARSAQVSRSRCFALFAAAAETTPLGYVTRRRMEVAAKLLRETNLNAAEIGQRVGYKTASHFGHAFKQYVGKTPRAYRLASVDAD